MRGWNTFFWTLIVLLGITRASLADEPLAFEGDEDEVSLPREMAIAEPQAAEPQAAEPQAQKQPAKLPWRTFEFVAGATFSAVNSSILLSRPGGGGGALAVQLETALGLQSSTTSPDVWTAFRFAERHRIQFSYTATYRSATDVVGHDIILNNFTIPAGTTVHTVMDAEFFDLSYAFSFIQDNQMDFAISLGVDVIRPHFSIEARVVNHTDNSRLTVPIPLPGFNWDYAVSKEVWFRQRLEWFALSGSNFGGLLTNFNVAVEWSFIDHLAIGLGGNFTWLQFRVDSNSQAFGSLTGDLRYSTLGFLAYLNVYF
jgi:hypothetical protein